MSDFFKIFFSKNGSENVFYQNITVNLDQRKMFFTRDDLFQITVKPEFEKCINKIIQFLTQFVAINIHMGSIRCQDSSSLPQDYATYL